MSDSGFRDIQLSGKHVVFLFMAGAVAAIAIFLLGVSVGRGVARPGGGPEASGLPADLIAGSPRPSPPSTNPEKGELQYHETLQEKPAASVAPSPSPAAAAAASPVTSPAAPPVTSAGAPERTPAKATPAPAAAVSPKAVAPAQASPSGTSWIQVDAFSSRANADRRQAELKAKGFAARVIDDAGSGPRYKVRVGPLAPGDVETMMARLRKEGYQPSRIR
jgi:rare lipoprotein A